MRPIKEMIDIMQAYEDGKVIEIYNEKTGTWVTIEDPLWNWQRFDYRIKPEEVEPKYRPYVSVDEWVKDFDERFPSKRPEYSMPLIWIKDKESSCARLIHILSGAMNFKFYFEGFKYLDGFNRDHIDKRGKRVSIS